MIIRDVIQRVQSLYSKGVQSDDSRLSNRHIYNKLVSVRSRLLTEKNKKNQKIASQYLPCIQLVDAPISECCCIPSNVCKVRRSKYKLPKLLSNLSGYIIFYVTMLDGTKVDETNWETMSYNAGNKYTANKTFYYIQNDYLYLVGNKVLEIAMMSALFEDLVIPEHFINCCPDGTSSDCVSLLDKEFPIDSDLLEPLITLTLEEILNIFPQMVEDVSNNSNDSNITQQ